MKKLLTLLLSVMLCFTFVLFGCGKNNGAEEWDETKTHLRVSNFDGGVGTEWLESVKTTFEAKYANMSFEDGKKGIQIHIDPNLTSGPELFSLIKGSPNDIFFCESMSYADFVSSKYLLDITDIMDEKLDGESRSIKDKLNSAQIESLTALDGKYYALPHYEVYRGVMYDKDLFESKLLYFSNDKDNGNDGFVMTKTEQRSKGPDGILGTYDDGLPSTYEEFFALCDYMVNTKSITPFVWNGKETSYTNNLLEALFVNYQGGDDVALNYTFNSKNGNTTEIITGFNGNTPITQEVEITPENGYLLRQQSGKYWALNFFERLLNNSQYYYSKSINDREFSHVDAQTEFIYSSLENKPIAMLVEGTYWENEASYIFDESIEEYPNKAKNRNFGFMPLPSTPVESATANKQTAVIDYLNAYCVINARLASEPAKVRAAKEFVKFCYEDAQLCKFTEQTGCAKGVSYEMTQSQLSNMTTFAQDVWNMRKTANVVYPHSNSRLYLDNESEFSTKFWTTTINRTDYKFFLNAYKNGTSAKSYFEGMKTTQQSWSDKYSNYFN